VQELTRPFEDPRSEFKTKLGRQELFYKLTKDSKYTLREESIITARITRIDSKAVRVVTDSGIPGIIMISDLKDKANDIKEGEIGKYYDVNEYLRAKVRQINFDMIRLRLSTKSEDMIDHRSFLKKNKILEKYDLSENFNFYLIKEKDFPLLTQDKLRKQSRYTPRRINHPKFKNISMNAAIDYLSERDVGDFVIRPSSKGMDNLNITWKLSSENIVHLDVREGPKGQNDIISKTLRLDREVYDSLDEIIERYIKLCNNLVAQIRDHKKFMDEPLENVREALVLEKKSDPSLIPYYVSFTPEVSQYLILSYIPKHFDVKSEYIKIKPENLLFHDRKFSSIKLLIAWFKSKLKTSEYQKYLDNTPSLYEISNRKIMDSVNAMPDKRDN
jgi:transcription elongation factor SPT6